MASTTEIAGTGLTVDPAENTKELAENLTEFEVDTGDIPAENGTEEVAAADRFQQRLERFGKIAPEAKKISRALRFGTPHEAIDETAKKRRLERFGWCCSSFSNEQNKKRQRGERFHTNSPSPVVDEESKQKRIDRFGVVTPSTSTKQKVNGKSAPSTPVLTEEIKKRTERFGDVSQVAKSNTMNEQKAKRAERFKPITSA
ncbi:hypothetical protein I4U23_020554 [Adineta vaga]|nr:hypothetical protein I4U23_020554 [Adineta vaga]